MNNSNKNIKNDKSLGTFCHSMTEGVSGYGNPKNKQSESKNDSSQ